MLKQTDCKSALTSKKWHRPNCQSLMEIHVGCEGEGTDPSLSNLLQYINTLKCNIYQIEWQTFTLRSTQHVVCTAGYEMSRELSAWLLSYYWHRWQLLLPLLTLVVTAAHISCTKIPQWFISGTPISSMLLLYQLIPKVSKGCIIQDRVITH